jgi:hypothetical protein
VFSEQNALPVAPFESSGSVFPINADISAVSLIHETNRLVSPQRREGFPFTRRFLLPSEAGVGFSGGSLTSKRKNTIKPESGTFFSLLKTTGRANILSEWFLFRKNAVGNRDVVVSVRNFG